MLKIIFAGTPIFAREMLKPLLDTEHQICAVYSQPDRPAGRGQKLTPSPVKELALGHDIPVHTPTSLKDERVLTEMAAYQADLMVVVAYGLILPRAVLEVFPHGCINVHASLLPRWRGAAPIQRAIEAGDKETGITIMQMDEGLDTGDALYKQSCLIDRNESTESLHDKLIPIGQESLISTLTLIENGKLEASAQDDTFATYAKKLSKAEALIDWQENAECIARKIRAFDPWPVAYTYIEGERTRIWKAVAISSETTDSPPETPGKILEHSTDGILAATANGKLLIKELQLAGKKKQTATDILNANQKRFAVGNVFQQS